MTPEKLKAFEFAVEFTKQLLTLGSGFLGLSLLILKDLIRAPVSVTARKWLKTVWVALTLSILTGCLAIGGHAGVLDGVAAASIYGSSARLCALFQLIFFLVGTTALVVFAIHALDQRDSAAPEPTKPAKEEPKAAQRTRAGK